MNVQIVHPLTAAPCVLLTGIPRGGTSVACELLNRLPDVRALDEPMDVIGMIRGAGQEAGSPDAASGPLDTASGSSDTASGPLDTASGSSDTASGPLDTASGSSDTASESLDTAFIHAAIERFAQAQRRSILDRGVARTKHVNGRVLGAKVSDRRDGEGAGAEGQRVRLTELGEIPMDSPSSPDFTLAIKHPVAFTALLSVLLERFPVYAIVRNPLAVLASWESVPMAVRTGHLGLPAAVAPEIAARLDAIEDRLERQLALLDWFYATYATVLPGARVVRYEDIVASGGAALAPVAASAAGLRVPLRSRNGAAVYDREHMQSAGRLLLERGGSHLRFYAEREVEHALPATG